MGGLALAALFDSSISAVSLEPGECLRAPEGTQILEVDRVDCADPHEFEVFATVELPDGPYPGDQRVFEIAMAACQPRLEAYSGAPPDPTGWLVNVFTPSREGWDEGDRGATCLAYRFDEAQFFATVQGSARSPRG